MTTKLPRFLRPEVTFDQATLDRDFAGLIEEADRNGHFHRPPGERSVDHALDAVALTRKDPGASPYVSNKPHHDPYMQAEQQPVVLSPDAAALLNAGIMAGAKAAADALVEAANELHATSGIILSKAISKAQELKDIAEREGNRVAQEFHKLVEFDKSMEQVWDKYRGIPDNKPLNTE